MPRSKNKSMITPVAAKGRREASTRSASAAEPRSFGGMRPEKSSSNMSGAEGNTQDGMNETTVMASKAPTKPPSQAKMPDEPIIMPEALSPAQNESKKDKVAAVEANFKKEKDFLQARWKKEEEARELKRRDEEERKRKEIVALKAEKKKEVVEKDDEDQVRVPRRKFFTHPTKDLLPPYPKPYAPVKYECAHLDKEFVENVKEINLSHTILRVSAHIVRFCVLEGNRACVHVRVENSYSTWYIIYHIVAPPHASFSLTNKVGYLKPGEISTLTFLFKAPSHRMPDDLAFCYSIFQTPIKNTEDAIIKRLQADRNEGTTRNIRQILKEKAKEEKEKEPVVENPYADYVMKTAKKTRIPLKPYVFHVGVAFSEVKHDGRGPMNLCGRQVHHPLNRKPPDVVVVAEMNYDPDEVDDRDELLASAADS